MLQGKNAGIKQGGRRPGNAIVSLGVLQGKESFNNHFPEVQVGRKTKAKIFSGLWLSRKRANVRERLEGLGEWPGCSL